MLHHGRVTPQCFKTQIIKKYSKFKSQNHPKDSNYHVTNFECYLISLVLDKD